MQLLAKPKSNVLVPIALACITWLAQCHPVFCQTKKSAAHASEGAQYFGEHLLLELCDPAALHSPTKMPIKAKEKAPPPPDTLESKINETTPRNDAHYLKGEIVHNVVSDQLERLGITLAIRMTKPPQLIIRTVKLGSPATYQGLSSDDIIRGVTVYPMRLAITVERGGKRYTAILPRPKQPTPMEPSAALSKPSSPLAPYDVFVVIKPSAEHPFNEAKTKYFREQLKALLRKLTPLRNSVHISTRVKENDWLSCNTCVEKEIDSLFTDSVSTQPANETPDSIETIQAQELRSRRNKRGILIVILGDTNQSAADDASLNRLRDFVTKEQERYAIKLVEISFQQFFGSRFDAPSENSVKTKVEDQFESEIHTNAPTKPGVLPQTRIETPLKSDVNTDAMSGIKSESHVEDQSLVPTLERALQEQRHPTSGTPEHMP